MKDRAPPIKTIVLAMWCATITAGGCSAEQVLLRPSTHPAGSRCGEPRRLGGRAGESLEVYVAPSGGEEPRAFVLYLGGNGDRAEWAVDREVQVWSGRPVEIWALNYPGYGASAGPPRVRSLAPAALAAYDAMAERAAGRPVFISATSIGAACALYVASRRPVAGLVLQNPPPLRQLLLWYWGPLNLWLVTGPVAAGLPPELDATAAAARATAPAVFIITGCDLLVPPPFQRLVLRAYGGESRVVHLRGAKHNARPRGAQLDRVRSSVSWLWRRGGA